MNNESNSNANVDGAPAAQPTTTNPSAVVPHVGTDDAPVLSKSCEDASRITHHASRITPPFDLPPVDPWPEPVDGSVLLDDLGRILRRFVVLPQWAAETLALWTLHTYAFQLRDVTVYLGIESPQKRCGKTTLLTALSELVNRPVVSSNISSPAFFRVIEEKRPTLLIDEADVLLRRNDQLRGILNSGYTRKTAYVVRVVQGRPTPEAPAALPAIVPFDPHTPPPSEDAPPEPLPPDPQLTHHASRITHDAPAAPKRSDGGSHITSLGLARFSSWCPKAMTAIGRLPEILSDRCILIQMQRKAPTENCERLRHIQAGDLRRRCARFVLDHQDAIAAAQPDFPSGLNDRAEDIWEPLLALADLAGGDWPQKSRQAALALTADALDTSPMETLLADILKCFLATGAERMFSHTLVQGLRALPSRPWGELLKGKVLTQLWLAKELRLYGIQSKNFRMGQIQAKGYALDDFREAAKRYLPTTEVQSLSPGPEHREPAQPPPPACPSQPPTAA